VTDPEVDKELMRKAVALLARRGFSRGDLGCRLARKANPEEIQAVLDRLEQLNLLNDADYAYNSAGRWIKQEGWGPVRVIHRLMQHKIPGPIAKAAIDRIRQEISDAGALASYLDRRCQTYRLPESRKGIHKLFQSLLRRGFPSEVIWNELRRRIPPSAWQDFETGE